MKNLKAEHKSGTPSISRVALPNANPTLPNAETLSLSILNTANIFKINDEINKRLWQAKQIEEGGGVDVAIAKRKEICEFASKGEFLLQKYYAIVSNIFSFNALIEKQHAEFRAKGYGYKEIWQQQIGTLSDELLNHLNELYGIIKILFANLSKAAPKDRETFVNNCKSNLGTIFSICRGIELLFQNRFSITKDTEFAAFIRRSRELCGMQMNILELHVAEPIKKEQLDNWQRFDSVTGAISNTAKTIPIAIVRIGIIRKSQELEQIASDIHRYASSYVVLGQIGQVIALFNNSKFDEARKLATSLVQMAQEGSLCFAKFVSSITAIQLYNNIFTSTTPLALEAEHNVVKNFWLLKESAKHAGELAVILKDKKKELLAEGNLQALSVETCVSPTIYDEAFNTIFRSFTIHSRLLGFNINKAMFREVLLYQKCLLDCQLEFLSFMETKGRETLTVSFYDEMSKGFVNKVCNVSKLTQVFGNYKRINQVKLEKYGSVAEELSEEQRKGILQEKERIYEELLKEVDEEKERKEKQSAQIKRRVGSSHSLDAKDSITLTLSEEEADTETDIEEVGDEEITAESLFNKAGIILNDKPVTEEKIESALSLYNQALTKAESEKNQIILISCIAALGDCHMMAGYIKTKQERYDEVLTDYRTALEFQRKAMNMADASYSRSLNVDKELEASKYGDLSDAISISVSHITETADNLKKFLSRKKERYENSLKSMLEERDTVKVSIGEERWRRSTGKSGYTLKREEMQEKLDAIIQLQDDIEKTEKELNISSKPSAEMKGDIDKDSAPGGLDSHLSMSLSPMRISQPHIPPQAVVVPTYSGYSSSTPLQLSVLSSASMNSSAIAAGHYGSKAREYDGASIDRGNTR